jgi:hypothetical protein
VLVSSASRAFAYALLLHFLAELPCNDARDGFGFRRFAEFIFVEELVRYRATIPVFFDLLISSFRLSD